MAIKAQISKIQQEHAFSYFQTPLLHSSQKRTNKAHINGLIIAYINQG